MDEEKIIEKIDQFHRDMQNLFQIYSVENETNLNVQLVISCLGYCMETLYFGADKGYDHQVSSIILSMMTPAKDYAEQRKKEMGLDT